MTEFNEDAKNIVLILGRYKEDTGKYPSLTELKGKAKECDLDEDTLQNYVNIMVTEGPLTLGPAFEIELNETGEALYGSIKKD